MASVSQQVATVAQSLQRVREECFDSIHKTRDDLLMRLSRSDETLRRETQNRETGVRESDAKIDKLVQAICAERSARNVMNHQLGSQLETALSNLDADQQSRSQERAEIERMCQGVKDATASEQARNEEQWKWHRETAQRLDARLDERAGADLAQQVRVTEMESCVERLRFSVTSVDSALA